MSKKLTLNNIKERLKNINPNISILSEDYIDAHTKLKCLCLIDGNEWFESWNKLSQGRGCSVCNNHITLSLEEAISECKNRGYIPLFNEYSGVGQKLTMKSKEGYKFESTLNNLRKECGHNYFDSRNPYTIENIRLWLALNNIDIELISINFINATTDKLTWKCPIHGKFLMTWNGILSGRSCQKCGLHIGDKNVNWNGGISSLNDYIRSKINPWKVKSFLKYKRKCDISGIEDKSNVIHHVNKNFSEILAETMGLLKLPIFQQISEYSQDELDLIQSKCLELHFKYGLGVCLTEYVHKKFHEVYGYKNNTMEQYEQFKDTYGTRIKD